MGRSRSALADPPAGLRAGRRAGRLGHPLAQAALLQDFATAHWQQHFGALYRELKREVCFTRRVLRQALGPVRLESLLLQGSGLTLAQAVGLGLAAG
jgi:hypothetical protein